MYAYGSLYGGPSGMYYKHVCSTHIRLRRHTRCDGSWARAAFTRVIFLVVVAAAAVMHFRGVKTAITTPLPKDHPRVAAFA